MNRDTLDYRTTEFHERRTRYCVAVIILNEGERMLGQLERMRERADLADIIIVDGMSTDGSTRPDLIASFGVRALLSVEERGISLATAIGIDYAFSQGYEGVITMDGNGKDGVEAIPQFIHSLDEGYDLIQGSRFMKGGIHKNTPLDRYIGIRFVLAPLFGLGSGFWYTDSTNAFRAMSMRYLTDERVQPIRRAFRGFTLQHYLIHRSAHLRFKVKEIPVKRVYPDDGSVPTKIVNFRHKFSNLLEAIEVIRGRYNPR